MKTLKSLKCVKPVLSCLLVKVDVWLLMDF